MNKINVFHRQVMKFTLINCVALSSKLDVWVLASLQVEEP